MSERKSGVLLHITSLPSPYGIGDLGPGAYKFADFLARTKQRSWQVLPLNPTDQFLGNSPYSSISTFAGNTLLVSPDILVKEGLLSKNDVSSELSFSRARCDYSRVIAYKEKLFDRAYKNFKTKKIDRDNYELFCSKNSSWLEDFALFVVIKRRFKGRVWNQWSKGLRDREPKNLRAIKNECKDELEKEKFLQHLFFKQWFSLKRYCNKKNIHLIGDVPIYVSYDSADVWTNTRIFKLNDKKQPDFVAGVPPDYFSKTGQLWGNPVYQWDTLKETGFSWWLQRMEYNLNLFDITRIDHFRGLVAYWEIPAGEKTAINGHWVGVPVDDFLNTLLEHFADLPIIAEDLGLITPDVREVVNRFGFPGMKVLLFAFGEDNPNHPYLPHNFDENCVVYTGTHDNNTIKGWLDKEASPEEKDRVSRYLKRRVPAGKVRWALIKLAMESAARTAIFPMQDILGLGEEARMNIPSTPHGNWEWRLLPGQLTPSVAKRLLEITEKCGRT